MCTLEVFALETVCASISATINHMPSMHYACHVCMMQTELSFLLLVSDGALLLEYCCLWNVAEP
eukprot:m.1035412 g.1035412  ORF g.1035412 m.1035412 type:complete len:64 (-) comp24138_c1_seq2:152-343(-)